MWALLMRLQFLMDCSGKGHFHGVQFFRDRLLQCHFPHRATGQKICCCMCSLWAGWGPAWATGWISALPWRGQRASLLSYPQTVVPGAPSPFLLHWPWVSTELFLSHLLTPLSQLLVHRNFYSFLNLLSKKSKQYHWLSQLWPRACPSWSWLNLAVPVKVTASEIFSQKLSLPVLPPPATKPCWINPII